MNLSKMTTPVTLPSRNHNQDPESLVANERPFLPIFPEKKRSIKFLTIR